jgi:hypothetical protein
MNFATVSPIPWVDRFLDKNQMKRFGPAPLTGLVELAIQLSATITDES